MYRLSSVGNLQTITGVERSEVIGWSRLARQKAGRKIYVIVEEVQRK